MTELHVYRNELALPGARLVYTPELLAEFAAVASHEEDGVAKTINQWIIQWRAPQ